MVWPEAQLRGLNSGMCLHNCCTALPLEPKRLCPGSSACKQHRKAEVGQCTSVTPCSSHDTHLLFRCKTDRQSEYTRVMTHRVLRSHSGKKPADVLKSPTRYQLKQDLTQPVQTLSGKLTSKLTGLSKQDVATLILKRSKLRSPSQTSDFISNLPREPESATLADAARSTVVFAQHEAGTAVCIAASGLILTCSHCVAESPEEYAAGNPSWLIFSCGRVVQARCIAWDERRDLALLQIITAEGPEDGLPTIFPFATFASEAPAPPKTKQTPLDLHRPSWLGRP